MAREVFRAPCEDACVMLRSSVFRPQSAEFVRFLFYKFIVYKKVVSHLGGKNGATSLLRR